MYMYKYVYNTLSVLFCKNKEKPTTFQREFVDTQKKHPNRGVVNLGRFEEIEWGELIHDLPSEAKV